mmetsp:Transcript_94622/g.267377  ORF Transcript_94622/g.267377 Transcript_94622/m.267377 type:complete len:329 (-) Transcript_94622:316-1302(-)
MVSRRPAAPRPLDSFDDVASTTGGAVAVVRDFVARDFVAEVERGHAGRTMQLVEALRSAKRSDALGSVVDTLTSRELAELKAALDREASAVGRNRLLRGWIVDHRERLIASWAALSLPGVLHGGRDDIIQSSGPPLPGRSGPTQAQRHHNAVPIAGVQAVEQASGGAAAVFDFDQTISTRHLGVFEDMEQATDRIFGGAARVKMLQAMLEHLSRCSVTIAVVTRNSRHEVAKALKQVDLFPFVARDFIFGFEDYEDSVPKSSVVNKRILQTLGVPAANLIFIDDDRSNIEDVRTNCPASVVIQCPITGLGHAEYESIIRWANGLSKGT